MSEKAYLRLNALGTSVMFTPAGEQLVFKEGVCIVHAKNISRATMVWLEDEGERSGIKLMNHEDVEAYEEALAAEAEVLAARAARQAGVDALIQGKDPEFIPAAAPIVNAAVKPAIVAGNSIQQKLAEAKAAAAAK